MAENKFGVKVGDVFVESWGYDQTNVDYYEVVRVMPTMVEVRAIYARTEGEGHKTRLLPDVGNFKTPRESGWGGARYGEVKRFKVKAWVDTQYDYRADGGYNKREVTRVYINPSSFSSASLWDGKTSHFDTLAAGYPGH